MRNASIVWRCFIIYMLIQGIVCLNVPSFVYAWEWTDNGAQGGRIDAVLNTEDDWHTPGEMEVVGEEDSGGENEQTEAAPHQRIELINGGYDPNDQGGYWEENSGGGRTWVDTGHPDGITKIYVYKDEPDPETETPVLDYIEIWDARVSIDVKKALTGSEMSYLKRVTRIRRVELKDGGCEIQTEQEGALIRQGYDREGNLIYEIDTNGNRTDLIRRDNRLIGADLRDNQGELLAITWFDALERAERVIDLESGLTTWFSYRGEARTPYMSWTSENEETTYEQDGVVYHNQGILRFYDNEHRVTREEVHLGGRDWGTAPPGNLSRYLDNLGVDGSSEEREDVEALLPEIVVVKEIDYAPGSADVTITTYEGTTGEIRVKTGGFLGLFRRTRVVGYDMEMNTTSGWYTERYTSDGQLFEKIYYDRAEYAFDGRHYTHSEIMSINRDENGNAVGMDVFWEQNTSYVRRPSYVAPWDLPDTMGYRYVDYTSLDTEGNPAVTEIRLAHSGGGLPGWVKAMTSANPAYRLDRAFSYGRETGNWAPFSVEVGLSFLPGGGNASQVLKNIGLDFAGELIYEYLPDDIGPIHLSEGDKSIISSALQLGLDRGINISDIGEASWSWEGFTRGMGYGFASGEARRFISDYGVNEGWEAWQIQLVTTVLSEIPGSVASETIGSLFNEDISFGQGVIAGLAGGLDAALAEGIDEGVNIAMHEAGDGLAWSIFSVGARDFVITGYDWSNIGTGFQSVYLSEEFLEGLGRAYLADTLGPLGHFAEYIVYDGAYIYSDGTVDLYPDESAVSGFLYHQAQGEFLGAMATAITIEQDLATKGVAYVQNREGTEGVILGAARDRVGEFSIEENEEGVVVSTFTYREEVVEIQGDFTITYAAGTTVILTGEGMEVAGGRVERQYHGEDSWVTEVNGSRFRVSQDTKFVYTPDGTKLINAEYVPRYTEAEIRYWLTRGNMDYETLNTIFGTPYISSIMYNLSRLAPEVRDKFISGIFETYRLGEDFYDTVTSRDIMNTVLKMPYSQFYETIGAGCFYKTSFFELPRSRQLELLEQYQLGPFAPYRPEYIEYGAINYRQVRGGPLGWRVLPDNESAIWQPLREKSEQYTVENDD